MGAHSSPPRGTSTVGARIRRLRIQAGLTQEDLAGTVVTARTISRIERGSVTPSRRTIEHIAGRLGCRVEDILGDDTRPSDTEVEASVALARLHRIRGEYDLACQAARRAQRLAMRTGIRRLEAAATLETALASHALEPSPASEAAVLEAARRALGECLVQEAARAVNALAAPLGLFGRNADGLRGGDPDAHANGGGGGDLHRVSIAVDVLAAWAEERSRRGAFAEAAWAARIAASLAGDGAGAPWPPQGVGRIRPNRAVRHTV
jgi:transcriptional regulator with XRE-family HTH domain